jgi:hypothetical protein
MCTVASCGTCLVHDTVLLLLQPHGGPENSLYSINGWIHVDDLIEWYALLRVVHPELLLRCVRLRVALVLIATLSLKPKPYI